MSGTEAGSAARVGVVGIAETFSTAARQNEREFARKAVASGARTDAGEDVAMDSGGGVVGDSDGRTGAGGDALVFGQGVAGSTSRGRWGILSPWAFPLFITGGTKIDIYGLTLFSGLKLGVGLGQGRAHNRGGCPILI